MKQKVLLFYMSFEMFMRTTSLILFILLQTQLTQAQWQWSNPQPSGYINRKVVFTDEQTALILNYNGDLIKTSDQGKTWAIEQNIPKSISLDIKDSTGVIGGVFSVYISTDNGGHWTKNAQTFPNVVDKVQIVSRDTIFVLSTNQSIGNTDLFSSNDRGKTWQAQNSGFNINALWMVDSRTGYATSPSGVFKTIDGGRNWQKLTITITSGLFNYVKFRTRDTGFLYKQYNQIIKTTDGGATWTSTNARFSGDVQSMSFVNDTTIVAVGDDGLILRSTDNGANWSVLNSAYIYAMKLYSSAFVNGLTGFAVGHRGRILKTTDAGLTWKQYGTNYIDVRAMQMTNDSTGYAATWNNIYRTTNKGQSWTMLPATTAEPSDWFESIHFFSRDTGIAISYNYNLRVFKTYDGGQSWKQLDFTQIYAGRILGIFYINKTTYLSTAAAYGYAVLKSEDEAETWKLQYQDGSYGGVSINQAFFTSEKTGYAATGYYVSKTVDSAKTWTRLPMIPQQLLRYTCFVNESTGFVTGDQSFMAKTTDSGRTWTQLFIDPDNGNVPGDLKQIKFFNSKIGFVVSANNIYRTVTAGESWKLIGPSVWDLLGMEIGTDTTIYAYGTYGMIERADIRSREVDLFKTDSVANCKVSLSARVTAVLTNIDSVFFEYRAGSYTGKVKANPFSLKDTSIKITASITGLPAGTYIGRVKFHYEGQYAYSDSLIFGVPGPSTPTITQNAGVLYSSAQQGNHWYLNNLVIAGANQPTYTPSQNGLYTVNTNSNGCISEMSQPYSFIITSSVNPALPEDIKIFPNPARGNVYIKNDRLKSLTVTVYNSAGVAVQELKTSATLTAINIRAIAPGTYWTLVRENKTSKTYLKTIVKL